MRPNDLRLACLLSVAMLPGSATASPPAPPPPYVVAAGAVLMDAANKDSAKLAPFIAPDISASLNGERVATGRAAWLSWWSKDRAQYFGRTIGSSMGWNGDGALLILDTFDRQDNAATPPPAGDPRFATRSTFYRFGPDGLVHAIAISEVDSFYTTTR